MSTFYIKDNQINLDKVQIIGDDVKHIKNVLRHKIGDSINICNENGKKYVAKIISYKENVIDLVIEEELNVATESSTNITLFQGLPKFDKMESIIQKCTELGVNEIVPIITERVIVKLDEKSKEKRLERWNKIAKEASKQSGRQRVPKVENVIHIKNIIEKILKCDIVLLPYEMEQVITIKDVLTKLDKKVKNIGIIIGPEGGFSENDLRILEHEKVKKVTLGPRILRTETAGIAVLAIIMYELDMS